MEDHTSDSTMAWGTEKICSRPHGESAWIPRARPGSDQATGAMTGPLPAAKTARHPPHHGRNCERPGGVELVVPGPRHTMHHSSMLQYPITPAAGELRCSPEAAATASQVMPVVPRSTRRGAAAGVSMSAPPGGGAPAALTSACRTRAAGPPEAGTPPSC